MAKQIAGPQKGWCLHETGSTPPLVSEAGLDVPLDTGAHARTLLRGDVEKLHPHAFPFHGTPHNRPAADRVSGLREGKRHVSQVVLLVDDEPAILSLISVVLTRDGYTVLHASRGAHALQLADRSEGPIDLLIPGITTSVMTGLELADELRLRRPETKVLLLSGHPDDRAEVLRGLAHAPYPFLLKPFTVQALEDKVRGVLTSPVAPTAYERRREPRQATQLPVRYRVDGTEPWLTGSALDISDCGILLVPAEPLEAERRIELSLTLLAATGRRRPGPMSGFGYVTRQAFTAKAHSYAVGVFVAF